MGWIDHGALERRFTADLRRFSAVIVLLREAYCDVESRACARRPNGAVFATVFKPRKPTPKEHS
jgi:hypothetical protein